MKWFLALILIGWSAHAAAQSGGAVVAAANASFADMPVVATVDAIGTRCGAGPGVNTRAVYCTSTSQIFITQSAALSPQAPYLLAHLFGHAVQVQHGVADIALRTITANRTQEAALRRDVTRMVECIAGVILAQAGTPLDLTAVFDTDPFADSHWGRSPLTIGPRVRLALVDRNAWLQRGYAQGDPQVCDTPSFPADLVVAAFRR